MPRTLLIIMLAQITCFFGVAIGGVILPVRHPWWPRLHIAVKILGGLMILEILAVLWWAVLASRP